MVEIIARRMAEFGSIDEAKTELENHLSIHFDMLDSLGIDYDTIDRDCCLFSAAAWKLWIQLLHEAGAA